MASGILISMMVIMPSFTIGNQGNPPAIFGVVMAFMGDITKLMGGTVDEPSAMEDNGQTDKYGPNNEGPAAEEI
jgi:hypothetical protein